jgi:hypothetical protein
MAAAQQGAPQQGAAQATPSADRPIVAPGESARSSRRYRGRRTF